MAKKAKKAKRTVKRKAKQGAALPPGMAMDDVFRVMGEVIVFIHHHPKFKGTAMDANTMAHGIFAILATSAGRR